MDSFSNRSNRPVAARQAAPHNAPRGAPEPAHDTGNRTSSVHHRKPSKKFGWKKIALIVGGVLLLAGLLYGAWNIVGPGSLIKSNRYQAVFLTNGQVYFGKLAQASNSYYKLTDVYYLQAKQASAPAEGESSNPQETADASGDVQLVKLGQEIHGPEDEMIVDRSQVLFFENLKDDSKITSTIKQYQSGEKK